MKTSHTLPLCIPPVISLLRWAYTLGITHPHTQTHDWFYSNFIQLSYNADCTAQGKELFIDYWRGGQMEMHCNNPFLQSRQLGFDTVPAFFAADLHQHLCTAVDNGHYVMLFVDEVPLDFSHTFGFARYPHHILIHGYDWQQRQYQIAGFGRAGINGQQLAYGFYRVGFDAVRAGIDAIMAQIAAGEIHDQSCYLFRPQLHDPIDRPDGYPLNLDFIRDSLQHYLQGRAGHGQHNFSLRHLRFGVQIYDALRDYLQAAAAGQAFSKRYDTRHFHLLWEHKQLMYDRLAYLTPRLPGIDFAAEQAVLRQQQRTLHAMKLRSMKHRHALPADAIRDIAPQLAELARQDHACYSRLLDKLQQVPGLAA